MNLELTPKDILYRFDLPSIGKNDRTIVTSEYDEVYKKIKVSLEIKEQGYNLYLIDDFSKEKIEIITKYIKEISKGGEKPKDICYVIYEDEKSPKVLVLYNGNGVKLKEALESIQISYVDAVFEFYNNTGDKEKEQILQDIQKKRTELVGNLVEIAKKEGFDVKPTNTGFSFIPLKEGEAMTEKDYENLEINYKDDILSKVASLKNKAQDILDELKAIEESCINKIKEIMGRYLVKQREKIEKEYFEPLKVDEVAVSYLNYVCDFIEKRLTEIYTTSFEADEEKINEEISRFLVNVLVDNSENSESVVIFEEDPSVINLLGSTEYENHNGTYITDVSLISGGSLLKANDGCIIIRANSLLSQAGAYYYLKKALLSEKVKLDYNKGYIELLAISGLKPEPININVKVILIGDFETYDLLYNYDEDFKNIFKIRGEFNPVIQNSDENKMVLISSILNIINNHKLRSLTDDAIKEVAKYLSRKVSDKKKFLFDNVELSKIIMLANNKAESEERDSIESKDIIEVSYDKEVIEKEILESYQTSKILINTSDEIIGSINGLSVIDAGYFCFGKPLRITCNCYKGEGNIVDVHKESNLSGNIHSKSVNILKGYLNRILGGYNLIPVDFHLSFEQLYGKLEGDSASVAEIVCIISALSKIPIKQSLAVTGSINQFGEVQPIGGVNEKIEGFFNVCKLMGGINGKGVLIPISNKNDLVLNSEVEAAIKNGEFHIYAMSSVEEAVEVLMGNEKYNGEDIFNIMERELKKYRGRK